MGRWLEHAPESVMEDWQDMLAQRTLSEIARGIARYEADPGKFPPGCAEFRKACAEFQPGTFAGGAARPLPTLVQALEGATITGDARAWIHLCKRLEKEEKLTRAELERLPAVHTSSGHWIRPAEFCTTSDDEVTA